MNGSKICNSTLVPSDIIDLAMLPAHAETLATVLLVYNTKKHPKVTNRSALLGINSSYMIILLLVQCSISTLVMGAEAKSGIVMLAPSLRR